MTHRVFLPAQNANSGMAEKPWWTQPWQSVSSSVTVGLLPVHHKRSAHTHHRVHLSQLREQVSSGHKMLLDVATALAEEQVYFINPWITPLAHKKVSEPAQFYRYCFYLCIKYILGNYFKTMYILILKSVRSSQNSSLLFLPFPVPRMPLTQYKMPCHFISLRAWL